MHQASVDLDTVADALAALFGLEPTMMARDHDSQSSTLTR
jgi:hypothetical protein